MWWWWELWSPLNSGQVASTLFQPRNRLSVYIYSYIHIYIHIYIYMYVNHMTFSSSHHSGYAVFSSFILSSPITKMPYHDISSDQRLSNNDDVCKCLNITHAALSNKDIAVVSMQFLLLLVASYTVLTSLL